MKKSYDKPSSIFKSRDMTLLKKFSIIKAMIFTLIMYGYDSWTIKNGFRWRIDGFELWYWTRLLRVPWTTRTSNKSMLKEINPEYSLEVAMLKLKLQCFGQLMWRTYSLKDPITGKDWRQEEKRKIEDEMVGLHHWLNDLSLSKLRELVKDRKAWHAAVNGIAKSWTWLSDWTELNIPHSKC